jgi:anti-sigma B factor antagonist
MELSVEQMGEALTIAILERRLDAAVAIQFKEAVRSAVEAPGCPVILDMSRVDFLDSSGLGAIVAVMKLLGPERPLELAGLTPTVAKVFRLTRMDTVFKLHPQVPDVSTLRAAG